MKRSLLLQMIAVLVMSLSMAVTSQAAQIKGDVTLSGKLDFTVCKK